MTNPEPALIFDIWELITDILGDEINQDNTHALKGTKALSLTCKAMVPMCQKHLFSTILLDCYKPMRSARFRSVISVNPGLIRHVRKVKYMIFQPNLVKVEDSEILRALIDRSSILQSVDIHLMHWPWDSLPNSFQKLLIQLIHLPTVEKLRLDGLWRIPSHIIRGCSNLTHLKLINVRFQQNNDYCLDTGQCSVPPSLVFFEGSGDCYGAIQVLMQPRGPKDDQAFIDFSAVKTLIVSLPSRLEERKVVWDLVQKSRELETLNLSTNYDDKCIAFGGLGTALSTHAIPTLRHLLISRPIWIPNSDPLCGLLAELTKISGSNVLEEISLDIHFLEVLSRTDKDVWGDFDSLVTVTGSFPMLKSVLVAFTYSGKEFDAIFRDQITDKRFPELLKSETVEFGFSAQYCYF